MSISFQFLKLLNFYYLTLYNLPISEDLDKFFNSMTIVQKQRWYIKITLKIDPDYQSTFIALIDSEADLNCIHKGLIPTIYFVKTSQRLSMASNVPLKV